jgi:hypothetical protein
MVAVAGLLMLVVANQIGGVLIARDLRDEYQQLVSDTQGQADPTATVTDVEQTAGGGVIPELTAKSDLQPAPDGESNVAVAPAMPAPADRSDQAIVDVTFEVVENVSTIDPARGTKHETWGYRLLERRRAPVHAAGVHLDRQGPQARLTRDAMCRPT